MSYTYRQIELLHSSLQAVQRHQLLMQLHQACQLLQELLYT